MFIMRMHMYGSLSYSWEENVFVYDLVNSMGVSVLQLGGECVCVWPGEQYGSLSYSWEENVFVYDLVNSMGVSVLQLGGECVCVWPGEQYGSLSYSWEENVFVYDLVNSMGVSVLQLGGECVCVWPGEQYGSLSYSWEENVFVYDLVNSMGLCPTAGRRMCLCMTWWTVWVSVLQLGGECVCVWPGEQPHPGIPTDIWIGLHDRRQVRHPSPAFHKRSCITAFWSPWQQRWCLRLSIGGCFRCGSVLGFGPLKRGPGWWESTKLFSEGGIGRTLPSEWGLKSRWVHLARNFGLHASLASVLSAWRELLLDICETHALSTQTQNNQPSTSVFSYPGLGVVLAVKREGVWGLCSST